MYHPRLPGPKRYDRGPSVKSRILALLSDGSVLIEAVFGNRTNITTVSADYWERRYGFVAHVA